MAASTTSGTHLEIETKLDADADFALPDLGGLTGVITVEAGGVQELEAVYLDSADLRLARHGTTFRRRTGGTDAGWHLKLPAAKKGRIEVRRALGRSERHVPPQLLGLVRVQLRGEPVAPVARIITRRTVHRLIGTDGLVLAEVADDQVTSEAFGTELTTSRWREIEVELVDGDDTLLEAASAALVEAGARPSASTSKLERALVHRLPGLRLTSPGTPAGTSAKSVSAEKTSSSKRSDSSKGKKHKNKKDERDERTKSQDGTRTRVPTAGEVVVNYLTAQVQALIAEDPRVRISADDGVHQMRVGTRRLRTALATFRPLFAEGSGESLRDELKWLGGLLGQVRDAEVMRTRLRAEIEAQPAELVMGPVRRRVDLELGQMYRDAHKKVITALDGERYLTLVAALEDFVARPPFSERASLPAPQELRARVAHACHRVTKATAGLGEVRSELGQSGEDHHLHQVRIAAKRARYAAEAVQPVIGRPARAVVQAMEDIQETLGDHQDAVVEREWLRDLAARAFLAGENGFTFGRLHGLTDARAQHDQDQFTEVWAAARTVLKTWPN